MPDVNFWYAKSLSSSGRFAGNRTHGAVKSNIKTSVAMNMDCVDDKGKMVVHDPRTQITILTFAPIASSLNKLVVMHVLAFDWPNRMRNIDERLEAIGLSIRALLELPPGTVDMEFIAIKRKPRPCWVNV